MTVVTVGNCGEALQYLFPFVINTTVPNFHSRTYFDVKFTIQQNVLRLQILMQEGWVHIVKEIDPQGDLVQNPQSQRPGELRVQVLLWTRTIVQVLITRYYIWGGCVRLLVDYRPMLCKSTKQGSDEIYNIKTSENFPKLCFWQIQENSPCFTFA